MLAPYSQHSTMSTHCDHTPFPCMHTTVEHTLTHTHKQIHTYTRTQVSQLDGEAVSANDKVHASNIHTNTRTQVSQLDGEAVSANDKVHASNMHGAAAEGLLHIRRKYFPRGELDDNGGTIPPPSAGLVASDAREEKTDAVCVCVCFGVYVLEIVWLCS